MVDENYVESVRAWRQKYAQGLLSPESWLAISGLFWLGQGENQIGTQASCQVALPHGSAPALAGTFHVHDTEIILEAAPGVQMTYQDQPVTRTPIMINDYGSSDWIVLNDLKLSVIQRGVRRGVRIYDKNNPSLVQFVSLRWYPIQPECCIQARFTTFEQPQKLPIVNVLGDPLDIDSPGYAEFTWQGETCRLMAIPVEDSDRLWFIFHDLTSKDATYKGGRYLTADGPKDGFITLDFNQAHNPPCAYTDFATCPLPPAINRLNVAIKAGETRYTHPTSLGG